MNNFYKRLQYKQNLSIISKAVNDLTRKNLIPEYTKSYVIDNIPKMAYNRTLDKIRFLSCPNCKIQLPSRMLMHQHLKYCNNVEKNLKENETIVTDTKVDF